MKSLYEEGNLSAVISSLAGVKTHRPWSSKKGGRAQQTIYPVTCMDYFLTDPVF